MNLFEIFLFTTFLNRMICLWKVKDNDQSAKRKGAYSLENQVKWGSTPYKIENIYVLSGCGDMPRPFFYFPYDRKMHDESISIDRLHCVLANNPLLILHNFKCRIVE
mgnify:CR=1 FL=1